MENRLAALPKAVRITIDSDVDHYPKQTLIDIGEDAVKLRAYAQSIDAVSNIYSKVIHGDTSSLVAAGISRKYSGRELIKLCNYAFMVSVPTLED